MDPNLTTVLKKCSNEDLKPLVEIITDKGHLLGVTTESLSTSEKYIKYFPNHKKYVDEIEKEILLYGGNTFANLWREEGLAYACIVYNVAKKFGVECTSQDSCEYIENLILIKILEKSFDSLSELEKAKINEVFRTAGAPALNIKSGKDIAKHTLQISGFFLGQSHNLYNWAFIATRTVFQPLGITASPAYKLWLTQKVGGILNPLATAASAAWLVHYLASPAYRIIIPSVVHVAYLRQKHQKKMGNSRLGRFLAKWMSDGRIKAGE